MPEASWLNLAIQIPIVVLFAYVMLRMQDKFLSYISDAEKRSKEFIREQRLENNEALQSLTDKMCAQFSSMDTRLDALIIRDIAHDAFVRVVHHATYPRSVVQEAEQAAERAEAEARAKQGAPR